MKALSFHLNLNMVIITSTFVVGIKTQIKMVTGFRATILIS